MRNACQLWHKMGECPGTTRLPICWYQLHGDVLETYRRLCRSKWPIWKWDLLTKEVRACLPHLIWIKQIGQAQAEKNVSETILWAQHRADFSASRIWLQVNQDFCLNLFSLKSFKIIVRSSRVPFLSSLRSSCVYAGTALWLFLNPKASCFPLCLLSPRCVS